jgi:hypothetical protein
MEATTKGMSMLFTNQLTKAETAQPLGQAL